MFYAKIVKMDAVYFSDLKTPSTKIDSSETINIVRLEMPAYKRIMIAALSNNMQGCDKRTTSDLVCWFCFSC